MSANRREFIVAAAGTVSAQALISSQEVRTMYGLIGKMLAAPGQRDALIAILLQGTGAMPGCLSYIVAKDSENDDAIWITEIWDTKDSHAASLALPEVKQAIAAAKPIIAGFGERFITTPAGGVGLAPRR